MGIHLGHWKRLTLGLGLMGGLLATIADGGLSADEVKASANKAGPKPTLHGLVLTTNGVPITNATVTIKRVLAGRGAVYVSDAPDCNRHATTMSDGSFVFESLAGQTKLEGVVTAPGYELQGFSNVEPSAQPLEFKLLPAPTGGDPQQTLYGRVVNAEGKPVAGAKVDVHTLHTEHGWHSGGGSAYTDPQGEFAFRAGERLLACDFVLQAEGYVPRSFSEVRPGLATNVYQLSQGTRVSGRLLKDGQPVPDAGLGLHQLQPGGWLGDFSAVTGRDGRFTFSGLPAHAEFYLFGLMRSLRDLGALPRQRLQTGEEGTRVELGDLHLVPGYTLSGRVQLADGTPAHVGAFTLARTELTPRAGHVPTPQEESNRAFYGLESSFDEWRAFLGADGRFEFTGVPGETVSIFLMLKPFDMLSPGNLSSDGKGFRLLGTVVSNKTDLVIELEPHRGQVFPPARNYEALSRQPLQGAEAALATPRR